MSQRSRGERASPWPGISAPPSCGVEEPVGALPEELRGLGFKDAARGPSPFPVAPWHEKQRTTENRQLIP